MPPPTFIMPNHTYYHNPHCSWCYHRGSRGQCRVCRFTHESMVRGAKVRAARRALRGLLMVCRRMAVDAVVPMVAPFLLLRK